MNEGGMQEARSVHYFSWNSCCEVEVAAPNHKTNKTTAFMMSQEVRTLLQVLADDGLRLTTPVVLPSTLSASLNFFFVID